MVEGNTTSERRFQRAHRGRGVAASAEFVSDISPSLDYSTIEVMAVLIQHSLDVFGELACLLLGRGAGGHEDEKLPTVLDSVLQNCLQWAGSLALQLAWLRQYLFSRSIYSVHSSIQPCQGAVAQSDGAPVGYNQLGVKPLCHLCGVSYGGGKGNNLGFRPPVPDAR